MRRISVVTRAVLFSIVSITLFTNAIVPATYANEQTGGVVVNDPSTSGATAEPSPSGKPGVWERFVDWLAGITDFDSFEGQPVVSTVVRSVLLIAGLVLVIFGAKSYAWASRMYTPSTAHQIVVRLIGAILMAVAFVT